MLKKWVAGPYMPIPNTPHAAPGARPPFSAGLRELGGQRPSVWAATEQKLYQDFNGSPNLNFFCQFSNWLL